MPGYFYIASSKDRLHDVRELARFLERKGMRNAFAWHEHIEHRCADVGCGVRSRHALAEFELVAARYCDLFVGIARLGKGSHVELGAALVGTPKRIVLIGVDRADLVFYDNEKVEVFDELSARIFE